VLCSIKVFIHCPNSVKSQVPHECLIKNVPNEVLFILIMESLTLFIFFWFNGYIYLFFLSIVTTGYY